MSDSWNDIIAEESDVQYPWRRFVHWSGSPEWDEFICSCPCTCQNKVLFAAFGPFSETSKLGLTSIRCRKCAEDCN